MLGTFCRCHLKCHYYEPVSSISIILELLVSFMISVCAIFVNYKYRKKLQEEKRARPLGRKGNVIEPIASWMCVVLIIGTPINLLMLWISANEIIPFDWIPGWLCILLHTFYRCASMYTVYHSLFVAIIKYLYIVRRHESNQWDFEKVGKRFTIASLVIPYGLEIIQGFFEQSSAYKTHSNFRECVDSYEVTNETTSYQVPRPTLVQFTLNYLPETLVFVIQYSYIIITTLVALNIIEVVLYYKIFDRIKR
jgi:membrane protein implicated in regulation of membrane protease activity